jgi:antitoxin YefM
MTTVPLGEAKDKLSEYVTSVERTHDRIDCHPAWPAAVLISPGDLADLDDDRLADNDAVRTRFNRE